MSPHGTDAPADTANRRLRPTRPRTVRWVESGVYSARTMSERLAHQVAVSPTSTALVDGGADVRLSFGELGRAVDLVADQLRARGLRAGDVITVQLPNWWEAVVVFQAAIRLGAVVNPVVPIYRERELEFILGQARPRMVVTPHRFRGFDHAAMVARLGGATNPVADTREELLHIVIRPDADLPPGAISWAELMEPVRSRPPAGPAPAADDLLLLLYTSGTTADPKGVLHSHQSLAYEVQSFVDLFDLGRVDTVFTPSPVTHITGFLYGVLLPLFTGCEAVLLDIWEPRRAVELIEQEQCRFVMGATPFLRGIVDRHRELGIAGSALRVFTCGGADVPPALVEEARTLLGCHVARVYGSSEFPTFSCGRREDGPSLCAETDGMPIGPVSYRIEDAVDGVGELVVDGPDLFLGYADPALNDAAFTADGHFRTGDLASVDENGAITIRGREKDIILRGGENISAKEVEDLLHQHPGVADVAVVAMPDALLTERACAFVVPTAGSAPTLEDLVAFLETQHIARQKLPERLEVVECLPVTASGKVQKFLLRAQIAQMLTDEATGRSGAPTESPA